MSTPWIDPARSRIVLVGVPSYTDKELRDYAVIKQNVADLRAAFIDPAIGGLKPEHCFVAPAGASTGKIGELLAQAAAEAKDLLLFYYCGHGLVGARGDRSLYLSVRTTIKGREAYTALPFEAVRQDFLGGKAKRRVVILDCCFSGRAIGRALSSEDQETGAQLQIDSSYILASAPAGKSALVLDGERYTAFTGRLLEVLREGKPGPGKALTLADIHALLQTRLIASGLPQLRDMGTGGADRLPLVRNRAYRPEPATTPPADSSISGLPAHGTPAHSAAKHWRQAMAVVAVGTGGVITGLTFAPGQAGLAPAHLTAPAKAGTVNDGPATTTAHPVPSDGPLRSAIVNVAKYYQQLAKTQTAEQMNALIWGTDSFDGTGHGQSCAAFASLVLQLGSEATGQHDWASSGGTFQQPVAKWADSRALRQDAQAHGRWHAAGGYKPQPGDFVLFDQHVEVITSFDGGVLKSIGADSLPDYSVNAHTFTGAAGHGIVGFVNNGHLDATAKGSADGRSRSSAGQADIPGLVPLTSNGTGSSSNAVSSDGSGSGHATAGRPSSGSAGGKHRRHIPPSSDSAPTAKAQQEFIRKVAPGAITAQQRYGVPASVTIAQAIEQSNWGTSELAARNNNLFGIKGTGPAGAARYPTQEYISGQWLTVDADFRAYHNTAESIADHARLLATSGYYAHAMADRDLPDAFAHDLTGVYATDPGYGTNLINIMRLYELYKYDTPTSVTQTATPQAPKRTIATHKAATAPSMPTASSTQSRQQPVVARPSPAVTTPNAATPAQYETSLPNAVTSAYFLSAKQPLGRSEQLYRNVATQAGTSWKLLAACDWMQCQADPRRSPVHGEKLGTRNIDGSVYHTRSEALTRCATDMIDLARIVYGIDITAPWPMSILSLAEVFAAFRWGGLLKKHSVSAMEFPYSVAGLTSQHTKMYWPAINEPEAPDKPGSRFRQEFGAIPVLLSLKYPATI